jgi:SAM-dependent methyltransferase
MVGKRRLDDEEKVMGSDSTFYPDSFGADYFRRISRKARIGIYKIFIEETKPAPDDLILDIGVSVTEGPQQEANILEQLYPYRNRITMLGIHEGGFLEQYFPGTRYVQYDLRGNFPFRDSQFDFCFCHAVIEHVAPGEERLRFVNELLRVGKKLFLTTPNRWYPLDFHKMIPLLHWLPQPWYRRLIQMAGDEFYSRKENLDLLSKRDLERLLAKTGVPFKIIPYRFLGLVSNLLVVAK